MMQAASMVKTIPAAESAAPIERAPLHVEALTMYAAVAEGTHPALRAAKVPA